MTIKLFLLFFSVWDLVKNVFLDQVSHRHDKKPLPEEVCGIYDADRYQSYLQRKHEYRVVSLVEGLMHLIADTGTIRAMTKKQFGILWFWNYCLVRV